MGPLLGSLLASAFYHLLCWVRWENINPGQDDDEWDKSRKDSMASSDAGERMEQVRPQRPVAPDERV